MTDPKAERPALLRDEAGGSRNSVEPAGTNDVSDTARPTQNQIASRSVSFRAEISTKFASLERIRVGEMKELIRRGVSALALSEPEFPARASVAFLDERPWFDFADEIEDDRALENAVIFLARNQLGEPIDLIAWSTKSGRLGAWFVQAPALGLEALWAPRVENDGALPVFKTPLRWLAAGRDGLLLVDPLRAAPILRDAGKLVVESVLISTET